MKTFAVFLIGVAVGFGFARWGSPSPSLGLPAPVTQEKSHPVAPSTVQLSKTSVYDKLELSTSDVQKAPHIPPQAGGRTLLLDERFVRELEDRGRDLHQEIGLEREDGGYRIQMLKPDSAFAKAGFVQGELITNNALEQLQSEDGENGDLSARFARILDTIVVR